MSGCQVDKGDDALDCLGERGEAGGELEWLQEAQAWDCGWAGLRAKLERGRRGTDVMGHWGCHLDVPVAAGNV